MRINTITYNSAIATLSRGARAGSRQQHQQGQRVLPGNTVVDAEFLWEKALHLIQCMKDEGVRRDSFTYLSEIGTCGAVGRWQEAVSLITAMKQDGARPSRVAYTSATSACANSKQWDSAYTLLIIILYTHTFNYSVSFDATLFSFGWSGTVCPHTTPRRSRNSSTIKIAPIHHGRAKSD